MEKRGPVGQDIFMAEKLLPIPPTSPSSSLLGTGTAQVSPRDELARTLSPVIAVAASLDADELCQKNHIPSFADYIKPFGDHIQGRVTPRDWQGTPFAIDNFSVRFKHIDKLDEPNHRAVMEVLDDHVKACGADPQAIDDLPIRTRSHVSHEYLDTSLDDLMPWYTDFKRMMLSLRGITEHETFDHPVAVLIVISSTNPDPMATIMQLYNPNVPSFTIDKPYVNPTLLRFYVLLHDTHSTPLEHSRTLFEKMKKTFGLHCHMLKMNSQEQQPIDLFEESAAATATATLDPSIAGLWEHLPTALAMESRLQAPTSVSGLESLTLTHSPLSPSFSGHRRSHSTSSNTSSNPPVHGPSLQAGPLSLHEVYEEPAHKDGMQDIHSLSNTTPKMQYGRLLTQEDIQGAHHMVKELVIQSLVPFMERNIQSWNDQVASARRGLTGRLFGASRRLFGTASRSPSLQSMQNIPATGLNTPIGTNTLTIYPYSTPEAQMRKLADYAFMLRDYKFAHLIYDTVRRDFATDKAYKHHAGTQEMIGVCFLMMNQALTSKVDVDCNFELAVQQYLGRCRSSFHATRATVMYYELLKARRMWKEVPTALIRMTGEDSDLRSALFLEQAAHCFLRTGNPMVRKYGFHLVMAGHSYGKALQRQHAFRCYRLASHIMEGQEWSIAKSHIQFTLGRQAYHLSQLEDAVMYFINALADVKQTPQQQTLHIREFLFIYRQYTTQAGIDPLKESLPNLPLPVIDDRSIHATLSNTQSNSEGHEEWAAMEVELLEECIAKGYISGAKKALAMQQQDDLRIVCAVGEPSVIHIPLFNSLQVSIKLSEMILGCEYRDSLLPSVQVATEADAYDPMIEGVAVEGTSMFVFDEFELEKISEIQLEPLEKRTIHLTVIPRREGSIRVKGLHYTLNDLVHTFKPFHKKGKRLFSTREQLMQPVYALDHTLDILVTTPMPLLDLAFHGIPESILSGELVQAVLEINNKGNKGMTALKLKTSHPSFICIGRPEEMDKPVEAGVSDTMPSTENHVLDNGLFDSSLISIPLPVTCQDKDNVQISENGIVGPGETTLVPLWIRGDRIGKHTFKFLFSYQSEERNGAIAHRTLRYIVNIQVLPSLKINAFTRPSTTALNEYILGIEIENLQTIATFQWNQISATSPIWTITPLSIDMDSPKDVESKTYIPPRQTTFVYYKIQKAAERVDYPAKAEAWTSDALEALLNNIEYNQRPPPIDLLISNLSFRNPAIPYPTAPLETLALNSRMHWRMAHLQNQLPYINAEKYSSLFTLYNSSDVDLTIYWDIPSMKRHGHHYIIGVNLGVVQNPFQGQVGSGGGGASRTMFEQTAKERTMLLNNLTKNKALKDENPIKLKIQAVDTLSHDFEKEGLLCTPVNITLQNCSWNKEATYKLELLSWSENKRIQSQKGTKPSMSVHPFHWTGATVFTGALHPEETNILQAQAIFQLAGVYDINRWKLTVETSHNKEDAVDSTEFFVYSPSLPQMIIITKKYMK